MSEPAERSPESGYHPESMTLRLRQAGMSERQAEAYVGLVYEAIFGRFDEAKAISSLTAAGYSESQARAMSDGLRVAADASRARMPPLGDRM